MNEIEKRLAEELGFRLEFSKVAGWLKYGCAGGLGRGITPATNDEISMWLMLRSATTKLAALESRAISLGYTKDQRDRLFGESK